MRGSTVHLLLALLALGFCGRTQARGEDPPGKPSVDLDKAPAGLKELVHGKGRMHAFHVSGDDNFLFAGDTAAFAEFLTRYAKIDGISGHRLAVHKGKGLVKSPQEKGEGKACDWVLDVALAPWRDRHVWRGDHAELIKDPYRGSPGTEKPGYLAGLHVWAGGGIDLREVAIPPNVRVLREDQLSLVLKPRAGREAVVGSPVDLTFVLRNESTGDFAFLEDCCPLDIVHEATLDVTEPGGTAVPGAARIRVGGPAFLGGGNPIIVQPCKEAELPCSRPDADKEVVWSPGKAGSHKIVGHYQLPVPSARPPSPAGEVPDYIVITSEPLLLDVIQPDKKQDASGKAPNAPR